MTIKRATSIAVLTGLVFTGFMWVHAHAMEKIQAKASIIYIDRLVAISEANEKAKEIKATKKELRIIKREQTMYKMKPAKSNIDLFMIDDIQAHIDELEIELKQ